MKDRHQFKTKYGVYLMCNIDGQVTTMEYLLIFKLVRSKLSENGPNMINIYLN